MEAGKQPIGYRDFLFEDSSKSKQGSLAINISGLIKSGSNMLMDQENGVLEQY